MISVIITVNDSNQYRDIFSDQTYDRIEILPVPEDELPQARNLALKKAKGEYVVFCHEKDVVTPDYLEYLLSLTKGVSLASCGYEICDENGDAVYESPESQARVLSRQDMLCRIFYQYHYQGYLQNKIFRRSVIEKEKLVFAEDLNNSAEFLFLVQYIKAAKLVRMGAKHCYRFMPKETKTTKEDPLAGQMAELDCYLRCKKLLSSKTDAGWLCDQTVVTMALSCMQTMADQAEGSEDEMLFEKSPMRKLVKKALKIPYECFDEDEEYLYTLMETYAGSGRITTL